MEKKSSELSQVKNVNVWVNKAPILSPIHEEFCDGISIRDIFNSYSGLGEQFTQVRVNGEWVSDWSYITKPDDIVHILQVPREPTTIAWIAITVSVLSAVAGYLLYAPPEGPTDEEKSNRISGPRNEAKRYDPVPVILGDRKTTPPYAAQPYTDWTGNQEYLNMLLCVGQGPLDVRDLKIGDTNVDDYEEVEYAIVDHYNSSNYSKLLDVWKSGVTQENVNTETTFNNFITRTSATNPLRLSIDIAWEGGLRGQTKHRGDGIEVQYQIKGNWYIVARPSTSTGYQLTGNLFRDGNQFYIVMPGHGNLFGGNKPRVGFIEEITTHVEYFDARSNIALINADTVPYRVNSISAWAKTSSFFVKGFRWEPVDTSGNRLTGTVSVRVRKAINENLGSSSDRKTAKWLNLKTESEYNSSEFFETIGGSSGDGFYPALIAMRIRATEQFSGVIDNLNCQVTSVVPVDWNLDWSTIDPTTTSMKVSENPAELFRWVLQGNTNSVRTPNSKIDLDSLEVWRGRCIAEGWKTSEYINYEATLKKTLNDVAFTGRAEFSYRDGKFSIVEKTKRTIPKQIFTPKNSANLKSRRDFPEDYDGIKFKFQNSTREDQVDEGTFYDPYKFANNDPSQPLPGVTPSGIFRSAEFWGVTDEDLAQRHARFLFFEEKLRRETFELETDIEGLVAGRGDMVRIAHDVIDVGVGQGFIKQDVSAGTTFSLDERKDAVLGDTYYFQARSVDSGVVFNEFSAQYQGGGEWVSTTPVTLSRGDLAVYGEQGKVSLDAIIVAVENQSDYGVRLTLVNAAPEIFDEDAETLPVLNTGLTPRTDFKTPDAPMVNLSDSGYSYDQGFIKVVVEKGTQELQDISMFSLQYRTGDQDVVETVDVDDIVWVSAGVVSSSEGVFEIPADKVQGVSYWLRAKAYSSNGLSSPWSVEQQLVIESDPSPDVDSFTVTEKVDEPKTPDGMFSTLVIQAEEQTDPAYLYAIVEYKLPLQEDWQVISRLGWKYPSQAEVQVLANGTQYQIRVRTANIFNVVNENGLTQLVTTTNTQDPEYTEDNPYDVLPVPDVRGLELFEQGNDTEFEGKDAKFTWRKSSARDWVDIGHEGLRGAGASRLDQYFRDYQVEVWADNTLIRTEFVVDNLYTYTYEKNAEDYERENLSVGAYREFQVRVIQRGRNNQISASTASLDVSNTAPKPLQNLSVVAGFSVVEISYNRPEDLDFAGVDIWVSETQGSDPDITSPVATVSDNSYVVSGLNDDTVYYVRLRPFDLFGRTGTNTSAEFSVTTKTAQDLSGLSGWAYEVDPVDRAFIDANLAAGAVASEKIVSLTAAKITAGVINATETITSEGLIRSVDNINSPQYQTGIGPLTIDGTTYLMWGYNAEATVGNKLRFGIDELGNAIFNGSGSFTGSVTIGAGSSGVTNLSDAGALATKNKADSGDVTFNYAAGSSKGGNAIDTDNVAGSNALTVAGGAARANTGLTGTGDVQKVVQGSLLPNFNPNTAGLSLTNTYLGWHNGNGSSSGWKTYVKSDGQFHFGGVGDNFIDWNGSKLAINTDNLVVDPAGNATFSGSLSGADGTFSGELQAATGVLGNPSGNRVEYDGTNLVIESPNLGLDGSGNLSLSGDITGSTITGSTIRTASSGQRVELDASDNNLRVYGAGVDPVFTVGDSVDYAHRGTRNTRALVTRGAEGGSMGSTFAVVSDTLTGSVISHSGDGDALSVVASGFGTAVNIIGENRGGLSINTESGNLYTAAKANGKVGFEGFCNQGTGGAGVLGIAGTDSSYGVKGDSGGSLVSGTYAFYAVGSGGSYGPFTGAHDGLVMKGETFTVGDILETKGVAEKGSVSDTIHYLATASYAMSKAAYGVFVSRSPIEPEAMPSALEGTTTTEKLTVMMGRYDRSIVNSVGEGQINVCSQNGDFEVGDLICTSDIPGKGMRYDGQDVRYVVAKCMENVKWDEEDSNIKMVACVYMCG